MVKQILSLFAFVLPVASQTTEMQAVLDKHNEYRTNHNVPVMTWDAAIATNAQAWVDSGNGFKHSSRTSRTHGGEEWGENLAIGTSLTGVESVELWYNEIEFSSPCGIVKSFASNTGHYTQVVWKSSVRLGCGKATTGSGILWACQYGPAGNWGGQFEENVLAPTNPPALCPRPPSGSTSGSPRATSTLSRILALTIAAAGLANCL